jgi:hypothetical protein
MASKGGTTSRQAALARARERRRQLDRERDAQDQRIEEATAQALVALAARAEAEDAVAAATGELGVAVRKLLEEEVTAERAAALLEIDVAEVRRVSKAPAPVPQGKPAATVKSGPAGTSSVRALPSQVGEGEDAARRAG